MGKPGAHRNVMASRQPTAADDPDFYPTPPWGGRAVAELIRDHLDPRARTVWEPACGAGHLVHALKDYFPTVWATDAYPYDGNRIHDFLVANVAWPRPDWVITNPPFRDAQAFVRRAWDGAERGVAMLLRVNGLESAERYAMHMRDCPLTVFAPFAERLPMAKGRYDPDLSSAAFYAWFIHMKPVARPHRFMVRWGGAWRSSDYLFPPGTEARLTRESDAAFAMVDRSRGGA